MDALWEAIHERFSYRIRDRGIDPSASRRVAEVREQLLREGRRLPSSHDAESAEGDDFLLALTLLAFPDRVCRRRGAGLPTGKMVGGIGMRLEPDSVVRDAEFFVAIDPRESHGQKVREARVRIASAIDPSWLSELFPEAVSRDRVVAFDEFRGRAMGVETHRYHDLVLFEGQPQPVGADEASRALGEWLALTTRIHVNRSASGWLTRLNFLRAAMPDSGLPEFDEATLSEVVASACSGKTSLDAVCRVPLVPLLQGMLSFAQSRFLDSEAPESLSVPTGNRAPP